MDGCSFVGHCTSVQATYTELCSLIITWQICRKERQRKIFVSKFHKRRVIYVFFAVLETVSVATVFSESGVMVSTYTSG